MILSAPRTADAEEVHELQSDPRVWTHLPSGRATDIADTKRWLAGHEESWVRDGLSTWVARDPDDGRLLGYSGCALRGGGLFWNLGYRFRPEEQGRGLATEISRVGVERSQQLAPDVPVVAYLLEHNQPSAAVARKLGLTLQHRGPDAGNPDPGAIRLVFADRELTPAQLAATLA
jgi:RimJ/RimL family protein N-acetyltransferase